MDQRRRVLPRPTMVYQSSRNGGTMAYMIQTTEMDSVVMTVGPLSSFCRPTHSVASSRMKTAPWIQMSLIAISPTRCTPFAVALKLIFLPAPQRGL